MWKVRHVLLGSLLAVAAAPLACGGKDKPADHPSLNAGLGSASGSSAAPPPSSSAMTSSSAPVASAGTSGSAAPSASALSTIVTTDPNQLAAMFAAAAAAANASMQPAGPDVIGKGDALETGLKALAKKQAPGMHPDGPEAKGTLQEGGHLAMTVTLLAGKCYAIVGYSPAGGVKDLDLHLLAPPFYNILSGEDTTDDNSPVIGKAPNSMCPVIPVGIPYKVDITAQKGAGPVAVQLYSKNK